MWTKYFLISGFVVIGVISLGVMQSALAFPGEQAGAAVTLEVHDQTGEVLDTATDPLLNQADLQVKISPSNPLYVDHGFCERDVNTPPMVAAGWTLLID